MSVKRWLMACVVCSGVLLGSLGVASARAPGPTASSSRPHGLGHSGRLAVKLDAALNAVNALKIPGYVVGVTGDGVGRFERAVGSAGAGQPMALDDHFRIGSISKTLTATVILELVDGKQLHLNDPISKWEPGVPNAGQITIGMLLNMTSGIWDEGGTGPNNQPSSLSRWVISNCLTPPFTNCGQYWKPQQIVDLAIQDTKTYGPAAPLGTYYYSDTNYVILGIIAQRVTGHPFSALLKRFVLEPVGMHQTSFPTHDPTIPAPATTGHFAAFNKADQLQAYVAAPSPSPSTLFGAGNVVSTLHDLQAWARALGTGALLKPRTQRLRLQLLNTGGVFSPLANTGVGNSGLAIEYGLGIADIGNMLGHNGEFDPPGFSAEMWYLPRRRGTVVVLLNSATPCGSELLADALNSSLSQIAFGRSLTTVPVSGPTTCPVPSSSSSGA